MKDAGLIYTIANKVYKQFVFWGVNIKIKQRIEKRYLNYLEFEDIVQQAWIFYFEAKETYIKEKSAFSTWIYNEVYGNLRNMYKRELYRSYSEFYGMNKIVNRLGAEISIEIEFQNESKMLIPVYSVDFKLPISFVENISKDASKLLDLLFSGEIYNEVRNRLGKNRIIQYMKELGWEEKRTKFALSEIKKAYY